jgi:hypothetical protein
MTAARMSALALSFPELARHGSPAPGVDPWDPAALEEWSCGPTPGSGALAAARFVLGVWNVRAEWRCGPFTLADFGAWDLAHREAFLAWARAPWWP